MEEQKRLWIDVRKIGIAEGKEYINIASNNGYDAVVIDSSIIEILAFIPPCLDIVYLDNCIKQDALNNLLEYRNKDNIIVTSGDISEVNKLDSGWNTGAFIEVNTREELLSAVKLTKQFSNILIQFDMSTNIPLELVLAKAQDSNCNICKIVSANMDGWIASMVMERGCSTVILQPNELNDVIELKKKIELSQKSGIEIAELTVYGIEHIGMGDRVCIDTTSLLKENEGCIMGSTSNGGILVSSETHYLPYMELRPFRVNAGAIHMYIWNMDGSTNYLSELQAGSKVMCVDSEGETRNVSIGRIKIERRPLLLIRAIDQQGIEVNAVVQDDWHVRIIGVGGKPCNCTELKKGDKILGYTCMAGRHVGVKINESIIEK